MTLHVREGCLWSGKEVRFLKIAVCVLYNSLYLNSAVINFFSHFGNVVGFPKLLFFGRRQHQRIGQTIQHGDIAGNPLAAEHFLNITALYTAGAGELCHTDSGCENKALQFIGIEGHSTNILFVNM